MPVPQTGSSALLREFDAFVERELRTYFGLAAALSDLESVPYGNVGGLAPVCTFLSLCALPLPPAFSRWEVGCTAFAPFLRGELRFYLDAQSHFVRALVRSLEQRLFAADRASRRDNVIRDSRTDVAHLQKGLRHIRLARAAEQPWPEVHWHGRPISQVTTIDEWLRVTQNSNRQLAPGEKVHLITPGDIDVLPFYARSTALIERGERAGHLICRGCVRPAQVPALVHFDLSPDHPLSQWLSGYQQIPDQVVPAENTFVEDTMAGDWAGLPAVEPWRQLLVEHLQSRVAQSFSYEQFSTAN